MGPSRLTFSGLARTLAAMRFPAAVLALALVACHSSTAPGRDMTGLWQQSGLLTDVITGDSHIHDGTFTLVQRDGEAFDGTGSQGGVCSHAGSNYQGPLTDGVPFQVLNGRAFGDSVEFSTPLCHFVGHFTDEDRTGMRGAASCSFNWNGQDYQFEGQWHAYR
jgi:hypothetical protein